MSANKDFLPSWYEGIPQERSWRRLFKWGDVKEFKHPNKKLYKLMKSTFGMTDDDFKNFRNAGLEKMDVKAPVHLDQTHLDHFTSMVGGTNISTDTYDRLHASYGKTMVDAMRLRLGVVENIADAVLYPKDKDDVVKIIAYSNEHYIPVYIYGGGSSVTRGMEAVKGGISLDMSRHMKRVLSFSEINQTITVEPGISGPEYERILNNAKTTLNAKRSYTGGHFPQSFEYSSVGGWVVTRGAGQNSTYYGKIEHMVISQEYVTPAGLIKTAEFPADACGPDIDQIMIGSEGAFGVLVAVTLKVFRYMPANRKRFSFIFRNWEDAKNAAREIMQSESGFPSVFRISDAEETDVAMKLYGVDGTFIDKILKTRGFKNMEKCLLLGHTDGDKGYSRVVNRKIHRICKKYHAMSTTGFVTKSWEHGRFRDPYLREDLQDFGIMIDTLECSVTWENMEAVHTGVRNFIKSRPGTISMTHISHSYPQGANLYFIFIAKMDKLKDYAEFQSGILDHIQKYGASMSHHHGIGKMTAPWLEGQIGKNQLDVIKALKRHFDPHNIMNPGGTLALDLEDEKKRNLKNT